MEKRIRGAPALAQDIGGCITTINNHLIEYNVISPPVVKLFPDSLVCLVQLLAQMQLLNDAFEIKSSVAQLHARQIEFIQRLMMLPPSVSRGYVTLVDATGREHSMLLDQCQNLRVRFHITSIYTLKPNPWC